MPRETAAVQPPWLFLMFQLPARQASRRVAVWRRLRSCAALSWRNSAYILPNTPENLERLQWLAREVRKFDGEASVVLVQRIEGVSDHELRLAFNASRQLEYERLCRDLRTALGKAGPGPARSVWTRLQQRLEKIVETDFFHCPLQKDAKALLGQLERRVQTRERPASALRPAAAGYRGRVWMTRPRPALDRVASAWLIRNFIDPDARFVFAPSPEPHPVAATARRRQPGAHPLPPIEPRSPGGQPEPAQPQAALPQAIAFDMFEGEFTHDGDRCTFEVLHARFAPKNPRLAVIATMVHDADLEDDKFHRPEGKALHQVLKGWAALGWPDEEILLRGFLLLDGLYRSLGGGSEAP